MKSNQHHPSRLTARQLFLIIAVTFGAGGLLAQGVPERMNYQGLLLTGAGTPITASTDVEFRIWDSPTNTTGLQWGRSFRVTPDANGVFNIVLSGEGTLLSGAPNVSLADVFTATNIAPRYLELTVAAGTAIRPRQQFLTAPYAFLANDVTAARQDFSVAGVLTVGSTVTASNFVGYGTIPLGGIIMWSGATNAIPSGWALCDGNTVNGVITPDLRGRFVSGAGQGINLTPRAVGDWGGQETVTLSTGNMPAHAHTTSLVNNGYPDNWGRRDATLVNGHFVVDPVGGGNLVNYTTSTVGGGGAHTNMPPYYALAFIIRVQ